MPFREGVIYLAEFLEDCFVVFGRDAYARVRNHEDHAPVRCTLRRHRHLALRSELQGVGDQVPEDLRNLPFICMKKRKAATVLEDEVDGVIVGQKRLEHAFERAEKFMDFESLGTNLDLPGFHLGQIEKVTNHLLQVASGGLDVPDLFL